MGCRHVCIANVQCINNNAFGSVGMNIEKVENNQTEYMIVNNGVTKVNIPITCYYD